MKKAILFLSLALMLLFAGCAKEPGKETANSNAGYEVPVAVEQADGSNITTSIAPNGIKSEVRAFPQGPLIQISRATWPDGRRAATVRFRDGRTVDLQDAADTEQVMTASSETISSIALKIMGATNTQPKAADSNKARDKKEASKTP
jgi:hypothetical protein